MTAPREPAALEGELRAMVAQATELGLDFDANAHFYTELGIPSVMALQLLIALEERFDIAIPDEDFVSATSLTAVQALVTRLLEAKT